MLGSRQEVFFVSVYLDLFFLMNFLVDECVLEILLSWYRKNESLWKKIIAGIIGGCGAIIIFLFSSDFLVEEVGSIVIVSVWYMMFEAKKELRRIIEWMMRTILVTYLLGGGMQWVCEHWLLERKNQFLFLIIMWMMTTIFRKMILSVSITDEKRNGIYEVKILDKNGRVQNICKGFYDSGNCLREPISKSPVHIVSKELFKKILDNYQKEERMIRFRKIPYCSIGKKRGCLSGFRLDYILINIDGKSYVQKQIYIAAAKEKLSTDGMYEIILNNELK